MLGGLVATGVCSYVGASLFFFHHPHLLHSVKKHRELVMSTIKHISHRGGAAEFPENTMAAFHNAVKCGTEMLEIDVHCTKDGTVVVFHDKDLKRVTGISGHIKDYNFSDLPKVRAEQAVPFPVNAGDAVRVDANASLHIPTLEELFQQFPGVPFNIDLKGESDELVHKTHELIKKYNREDLVVSSLM